MFPHFGLRLRLGLLGKLAGTLESWALLGSLISHCSYVLRLMDRFTIQGI